MESKSHSQQLAAGLPASTMDDAEHSGGERVSSCETLLSPFSTEIHWRPSL